MRFICSECNGVGVLTHHTKTGVWSELCRNCGGPGTIGVAAKATMEDKNVDNVNQYKRRSKNENFWRRNCY